MTAPRGDRPWAHAVLLAVVTALVTGLAWLRPGISDTPILWDHAYFTVLGQTILRGESIYAQSFLTYPPLGPLVSAGAMGVGRVFDLPTYLAPRYLAVAAGVAGVFALALFTRRATDSVGAGLVAGLALAGFGLVASSVRTTLEPKLLLMAFTPLAALAVQRRSWLAAGIAAGGAATCWQVGGMVALACLAPVLHGRRTGVAQRAGALALGFALGVLPAALYLTMSNGWWDFWQRSVAIPADSRVAVAGSDPLRWLGVAWAGFPNERWFFVAAGAGLLWFSFDTLRKGVRGAWQTWADPRFGALPPLTLGWVAFNSLEFNNQPDLLPFLPIVAFWCGWLVHRILEITPDSRAVSASIRASLLTAAAAYAFADTATGAEHPDTNPAGFRSLGEEVATISKILEPAGSDGPVVALSAEEVYALSDRRSPLPVLRLAESVIPLLPRAGIDGCPDLERRISDLEPAVVVIGVWHRSGDCERRISEELRERGYVRSQLKTRRSTWYVHRRGGSPKRG